MFEVIDGGKFLFYRVTNEIRKEVKDRRERGEKEWIILDYIVGICKERQLKANEAAMVVYMMYRLRND